ncbi:MAG: phosphate acetyltransferase [Candidatus Cloacimonetes bacterium]|jgi:phosphate acetyltransferase|nr:phosphate acetyltransferase [Candidatus Cloacimonadota bacterium]MCB5286886.1 phosphate acetyltransferase [Candidatus Cloacimonadota bacterium]MCK9185150.1 phosphate acetyltransferase [Candidatus Cloacimonadota bacterium]MCK9584714.1 phosphate acetyltransferase [Candidatus Cloacimonadota bacterium]MDY0229207.1 phosphate acetyltransferase [Candidatus Cloacimonadaceae bacterium]
MHILEILKQRAMASAGTIVLPEANDKRTLAAAAQICAQKIAHVVLLGQKEQVLAEAAKWNYDLAACEIIDPATSADLDLFTEVLYERRKEKGMSKADAQLTMQNPLYFGAMMVKQGRASGMVAGAANTTADVLRSALHVVGVRPGLKTVSSCFIMVSPQENDKTYLFADCAVVPNPTAEQLADIASSTAESRRSILADEPLVALLSFSTLGSAEHELVEKVREAKGILDARKVDFSYDGELQLDAAIIESIARSKAPHSKVAGRANTLVFPDLQAANIGYKLVQRLGGYEAIGPIIQGLAAPICDLSRGCSVQDIVNTSILVLLMSKK